MIFEAFNQEDFSITRRFGGTGLGLSIANRLLALMGSRLYVESEIGKGSEFYFELILPIISNSKLNALFPREKMIGTSEKEFIASRITTVLIAEDNSVNMMLAKTIVKKILPNAKIIEARNGKEALDYCIKALPDIIFMDIQMPELNGYEATMEIRKLANSERLRIIALTAGTVSGEKERCIAAGMNDYMSKPAMKVDFERILKEWLM